MYEKRRALLLYYITTCVYMTETNDNIIIALLKLKLSINFWNNFQVLKYQSKLNIFFNLNCQTLISFLTRKRDYIISSHSLVLRLSGF